MFKDIGSNWGKWDLHVHTASSYDYQYKGDDSDTLLVKAWKENEFVAVAITDHFIIDKERIENLKRLSNNEITIFPGVELRTDKGGLNIHVILIFNDESNLDELSEDFQSIMLRQKAKPTPNTNETIYWDYNHIVEFAMEHDGIISIHSGNKTNGIDDVITNTLPVGQAIKTEYAETVGIYEVSKIQDIYDYERIVFKHIKERPVIICSDNHDPRRYSVKEYLWIKAKPSFNGLKQAIIHPKERVFIGEEPLKVSNVKSNKEKFISSVAVLKKEDALNKETWFNYDINLNVGLTTIIGNKGSGKSAFADLLGYIGKSENIEAFSFLSKTRFAKEDKKFNLDYKGSVIWFDQEMTEVSDFSLSSEHRGVPLVRYLPQRYIEETCNSLDEKFQNEIDNVIFSYVDSDQKGEATTLSDLVKQKQTMILIKEERVKQELSAVNANIIQLERKRSTKYKQQINDNYEYWRNELRRHEDNKPREVLKPTEENHHQTEINLIAQFNEIIEENLKKVQKIQDDITFERNCVVELSQFKESLKQEESIINALDIKGKKLSEKFNVLPIIDVKLVQEIKGLESKIAESLEKIECLSKSISTNFHKKEYGINYSDSEMEQDYNNASSWFQKNDILEKRINKLKDVLGRPQKNYQKYLDELKKWNDKKQQIIGDESTPSTLTYATKEYHYLKERLDDELRNSTIYRRDKVLELFQLLIEKRRILDEIYMPIESKLDEILKNIQDKVRFKASVSVDYEFEDETLSYINQSIQSNFKGKREGKEYLASLVRSFNVSDFEDTFALVSKLLESISIDEDKADQISKKRLEFYDYVTSLRYLKVGFSLKMGDKELTQLSPGEKGAVLLIFYLALDQEEKPLIIDQPEDNLDNQSIFDKLVPCVLEAKKNRQVILVTHNPNLAIACDSELVIYSESNRNSIKYIEGPIEDKSIKEKLVDILEGTMPAFDLRTQKYKELHFSSRKT